MSHDPHTIKPDEPLPEVEAVVVDDATEDADPAACPLCEGPVRICGGPRRCRSGHLSAIERRWVTAIRLVHAGLCLTPTTAALWGGALLRLACLLTRATSVSSGFVHMAAEFTDPGGALSGEVSAGLAMVYLQHRDVDRLEELFRSLRDADAPWLVEIRILVPRAALSTPLEHARFALFAVPCMECIECAATAPREALFTHVGTYDAAIRCPRCGAVAAHPLPVRIGAPHPVGRCVGSGRSCLAHEGHALDASGLCGRGRATMARARSEAARIHHAGTAQERELLDALARAREVAPAALVATLAALDPRAARELARIPNLGKLMSLGEELAHAITSGLDRMFGARKPAVVAALPARGKRRPRRKGAKR